MSGGATSWCVALPTPTFHRGIFNLVICRAIRRFRTQLEGTVFGLDDFCIKGPCRESIHPSFHKAAEAKDFLQHRSKCGNILNALVQVCYVLVYTQVVDPWCCTCARVTPIPPPPSLSHARAHTCSSSATPLERGGSCSGIRRLCRAVRW